ncbi:MAG: Serine/threonine-protein kinase AfsK [bacterium ADurb.Bin363]|nr:MAG: Serine/threonine-protein kinase AfsK [bacterium ADurb.Bin363]
MDYISKRDTSESAYRLLGDLYYAQGLEEKAASMYEKSLGINPEATDLENKITEIRNKYNTLKYYLFQAQKNIEMHLFEEAINLYKEAIKLSSRDASLYFAIGEIYERINDKKSAYEYYKQSVDMSPANLIYQKKYHLLKVDIEGPLLANMDEKNTKQMIYLLKSSIENKEEEQLNLCRLGEFYLYQGMYQDSLEAFKKSLEIEKTIRVCRGLSIAYNLKGDIHKAIETLNNLLAMDNSNEKDIQSLVELHTQLNEKIDESLVSILEVTGLSRESPRIQFFIGILLETKNWEEAAKFYKTAIEKEPKFAEAYYKLGTLLLQNELFEEAEPLLNNVLKLEPEHYKGLTALGRLLIQKNELSLAKDLLKKAISINPFYYEPNHLLGKIFLKEDKIWEAESYIQKADKYGVSNPNYYIDKAEIYLEGKDINNAIKSIAKAVTMGVTSSKIINQIIALAVEVNDYTLFEILSDAFDKQGEPEQVEVIYSKMINLQPDNVFYRVKLGRIYRKSGRNEEAINLLTNFITDDNINVNLELAEAHFNMAKNAFEHKDWATAIDHIKKAIKYNQIFKIDEETIKKLKNKFTSRKLKAIELIINTNFTKETLYDKLTKTDFCRKEMITFNAKELELIRSHGYYVVLREEYHILLGDIYVGSGKYTEAIDIYFKALEINPKNATIFFKYGKVLENMENYREAADAYSDGLALDETNIPYYDRLAELRLSFKEYHQVYKITTKALSVPGIDSTVKTKLEKMKYTAEAKIWTMFKKDIVRCSYNPVELTENQPQNILKQKWIFKPHGKISSSPVISDEIVYIGSEDTRLYCLNKEDGKEKWNFNTNGEIKSTPVIELKTVYLASNGGFIYALDKASLYVKWLYETKSKLSSSPLISGDIFYIGSENGIIYALSIETGELKWIFETTQNIVSSPVIDSKGIYFGTTNGTFYALTLEGKELWVKNTGGVQSSPALFEDILFFGTLENKVLALLAKTGDIVWEFESGGKMTSSPAIAYNKIFIGSEDKNIYALDATTGNKIWEYKTNGEILSSPAIANGILYAGNNNGILYAIDVYNQSDKKQDIGGRLISSPAIADNMLFIASEENGLYAFDI